MRTQRRNNSQIHRARQSRLGVDVASAPWPTWFDDAFVCAADAHHSSRGGRPALRAIRLAVLSKNDRGPNLPFREVVLTRRLQLIRKREDVFPVASQAFGQPPGVSFVYRWYEKTSMLWSIVTASP